jgi:hypothetical protein
VTANHVGQKGGNYGFESWLKNEEVRRWWSKTDCGKWAKYIPLYTSDL